MRVHYLFQNRFDNVGTQDNNTNNNKNDNNNNNNNINNNNNNNNKKVLIAHLKFSMRVQLHMIEKNINDKSKNAVKYRNSVLR